MCGRNHLFVFLLNTALWWSQLRQLGAEKSCQNDDGLLHLLSVQWIGRGRFALCGVPSNLPDAAITGIYGNHTVPLLYLAPLCRKAVGGRRKWWWWEQRDCMFISVWNICERKQQLAAVKNETKLLTVPHGFEWPVSTLSRGYTPNRCCTVACAWPTHGTADLKKEKMRNC